MIKKLLFILVFISCSKQDQTTTTKIILSGNQAVKTVGAPGFGGLMIWGKRLDDVEGKLALSIPDGQTQVQLKIPSGLWIFAMMAWTGTEDETNSYPATGLMTGSVFCDFTPPTLVEGDAAEINLSVNPADTSKNAKCQNPVFGNAAEFSLTTYGAPGTPNGAISYPVTKFNPLHLINCSEFDSLDLNSATVPDECAFPAHKQGRYRSFRVELLGFNPVLKAPTPGLRSECLKETTALNRNAILTDLSIPGTFGTRIHAFRSSNCSDEPKQFIFPEGLERQSASFDHLYMVQDVGTVEQNALHLPDSISGSGFTPFSDILPIYSCSSAQTCAADSSINLGFKAHVQPLLNAGTGPYHFFIPQSNISYTVNSSTVCDIDISSYGGTPASRIDDGPGKSSCTCTSLGCLLSLYVQTDGTYCIGPNSNLCTQNSMDLANVFLKFDLNLDTGAYANPEDLVLIDGEADQALDIMWSIAGHPKGKKQTTFPAMAVDNNSRAEKTEGLVGAVSELLGSKTMGGILFKKGISTCEQALPGTFDIIIEDEQGDGSLETASIVITNHNTSVIPDFIFGQADVFSKNLTQTRFDKKIVLTVNFPHGTEKFEMEFNCPNGNAQIFNAGIFAGKFIFAKEEITQNGTTIKEKTAFFYNMNPATEDSHRGEFFQVHEEVGLRKSWLATRLFKQPYVVGPSATALPNRSYGHRVFVSHELSSGLWIQLRNMITMDLTQLVAAREQYIAPSFTLSTDLTGNPVAPFDTKCRNLSTFQNELSCPNLSALSLVSTLDFHLEANPLYRINKSPSLDSNGAFHFNWVGKILTVGPCAGRTAMECAIKDL